MRALVCASRSIRALIVVAGLLLATSFANGVLAPPAHAAHGAMVEPVSGVVTSRVDDRCGSISSHAGIDIARNDGAAIGAAYPGTVTTSTYSSSAGYYVALSHTAGYSTRYLHMNRQPIVVVGQQVSQGQTLGYVGSTGDSTGPHLHFEVLRNGAVYNMNAVYTCGEYVTKNAPILMAFPDLPPVFNPTTRTALLRNTATPGAWEIPAFNYGSPPDINLACDFNGDGRDDYVSYAAGTWAIRFQLNSGAPDLYFQYGWSTARPVCGDWDGNGVDGIGVFGQGNWQLRNSPSPGAPDANFAYGGGDYFPVVGDWDGNGTDTIGVVNPYNYNWLLRNANSGGPWNILWQYGFVGSMPVPGNYSGDARTELAVYQGGRWYVRDGYGPGPARVFDYGGENYLPFSGDWNADGIDGIGVSRPA